MASLLRLSGHHQKVHSSVYPPKVSSHDFPKNFPETVIWGTSNLRPLDVDGQKKGSNHHTTEHQDCLVGGRVGDPDFRNKAHAYIQEILPCDVTSFPGLTISQLDTFIAPGGKNKGKTVAEVLASKSDGVYSACILGGNDKNFFLRDPATALKKYLNHLERLYWNTNFEVIFITTVFSRRSEMRDKLLMEARKNFNEFMKNHQQDPRYVIKNSADREVAWRVVDMTGIIKPGDLKNDKYFCEKPDGTHFNAIYMEEYLRELAREVWCYYLQNQPMQPAVKHQKTRRRYPFDNNLRRVLHCLSMIDVSD